ncbi:5398_t:CDS:2, partial [Racocetra fulgida]
MTYALRADVISYLQDCFKEPNNRVKLGPIIVSGQPSNPYPDFPCGDFKARLWARRALLDGALSLNATLTGNRIYVNEWECGTIHHNTHEPTSCNALNNNEFQVTIPVRDAFWDPPILGGVPNVENYTEVIPDNVVGENFVIDLYDIQQ